MGGEGGPQKETGERASAFLAGEVAAGGGTQLLQLGHSLGDKKMPGSGVLTVLQLPS